MNKLILAAAAIAALGFVTTSTAEAGGIPCPRWECGSNGTSLNGIALKGVTVHGILLEAKVEKNGKQVIREHLQKLRNYDTKMR